jgi:CubicO group peptidase (beta-lactamase class C family)
MLGAKINSTNYFDRRFLRTRIMIRIINCNLTSPVKVLILTLFSSLFFVGHALADDGRCHDIVGENFDTAIPSVESISSDRLLSLISSLDEARYDVRALIIMRDCKIVFERYKDGLGRQYNHAMYSVTKSISSTLVGALMLQGKIKNLDTPVATLIPKPPGLRGDAWSNAERVTLRNFMQMSSGFDYKHDPVSNPIYDARQDRVALAIGQKFIAAPGTRFNYSDADALMTGTVIASLADRSLLEFAKSALFEPLHMSNYAWWFPDQGGRFPGGWGLRLRPMDMLKIGQLYLQKGEWNGARIFDESYPDLAWAPGVSNRYGLHWWIGKVKGVPFYFANGFKGQRIYVFPSLRVVAALASSLPDKEEAVVPLSIVTAIIESTDAAHPVDAESDAKLMEAQKAGFHGETRVRQDNQDSPRRF